MVVLVSIDRWVWFATNFCFRKLEPMSEDELNDGVDMEISVFDEERCNSENERSSADTENEGKNDEDEVDDLESSHLVTAAWNITQVSEIEPTVSNEFEKKFVIEFLAQGCGCKSWNKKPCSFQFSSDYITEVRSTCASLAREELDMVILGQIMALSNCSELPTISGGSSWGGQILIYFLIVVFLCY